MASGSENCKPLRQALRSSGCPKVFILEDGYSGWLNAGFPILQGPSATYTVGALGSIQKSSQLLADSISPLRSPSVYIPLVVGLGLGLWTILNYRIVLRIFGVVGLLGTALFFLAKRYETPKDMLEDVIQLLTQGYTALSGRLQSLSKPPRMPVLESVPSKVEDAENADKIDAASQEEPTKKTT